MDTNEQNQQDKRELRHKRRQRNQIIAYTAVGIMILLLAGGIAFGAIVQVKVILSLVLSAQEVSVVSFKEAVAS